MSQYFGWPLAARWAAVVVFCAVSMIAEAKVPRAPDGRPDLSGIWQALAPAEWDLEPHVARKDAPAGLGVVDGNFIPYQPWALARRQKNFENRATEDPLRKCFWLGVPRINYYPQPFQIFQQPRQLTFVYEYAHAVRTIHANGTPHPPGPIDWWLGDSRGHWEGDTLVVDVAHQNEQTWLDRAGNFHSDELRVVERYTLEDADHIRYEAELDDPKVYTRPWRIGLLLYRIKEPGMQLLEYECYTFDYEKYYP